MEKQQLAKSEKRPAINEEIAASEVRLIDLDGKQIGVVSIRQAIAAAEEVELDLVEIVPEAEPPVCRIMDYGKFRFEQKQKQKEARKKQHQIQIKELKLRPGTEEADYHVKLKSMVRFLEEGDKAKVTLRFRGREMVHQEFGMKMLQRIEADLSEFGVIEQHLKMEGKMLVMVIAPRRKK